MIGDAGGAAPPERPAEVAGVRRASLSRMLSLAIEGLFALALLYTLRVARVFLLPVVLALVLSLLLGPVVRGLKRLRIPEALGAGIVVLALIGVVSFGLYRLGGPASDWMERAPRSLRQLETKVRQLKAPVEKVSAATEQVERLTSVDSRKRTEAVEVKSGSLSQAIFARTGRLLGSAAVVVVLLYFLLSWGEVFLGKVLVALPGRRRKVLVMRIARHLERDISVYLLTITLINAALGVAVGVAMSLLGMPNPTLWGAMAALLNFIPYLGAVTGIVVLGVVAALTFDGLGQALLPPAVYFLLTATEGYLVTPLILGRRFTLNPLVIVLGLLFWGWLWGLVGALLAVPILVTTKVIADHVKPLRPLGEFLGR